MSQLSDISDSVIGVKRNISDISDGNGNGDSDSDSVDTIFSKNDNAVSGLVEPGKPILKKGVSKSVNPTIPQQPPLDKGYENDARTDARFAGQQAREQRFSDVLDLKAKLSRQQQNRDYNAEARLKVVKNDAEKRAKIIALFKKFEEENPRADALVTFSSTVTEGTSKRKTLKGTVTVEENKRQKSRVVADNVSDILFELLKDIQPEEVNTKIDELIANASQVNKSFKRSDDELTVRQVNNLKNAGLFDDAIEMTFDKLNRYKNPDTAAAYTKGIIDSDKDKLSSWLFGTTTEGGYSRSKTIKRSKKTKKRRSSKKLTKSKKRSKKRSKKTKK